MPKPLETNSDLLSQQLLAACKSSEPFAVLASAVHPALSDISDKPAAAEISLADSSQGLERLYRFWQRQQPKAGERYWVTRTWTMLSWQAVSLSLIGVYAAQRSLDFSQLVQGFNPQTGVVSGYKNLHLSALQQSHAKTLASTCQSLKQLLASYFQHLQGLATLREPVAMRLVKDQLARFMLLLAEHHSAINAESLNQLLQPWYQQLQLSSKSPFFELELGPQRSKTLAKPSACCQHHLRPDGDYCLACPKLNRTEQAQQLALHQQELQQC
ncbi:siderophore ferric iron reductase [Agarivorans sp.]|uniref:siderophore ferric iron reductase n=1 Tax=Agarivorans sp. TaxID=1872412 RepID=UPI003CFD5225